MIGCATHITSRLGAIAGIARGGHNETLQRRSHARHKRLPKATQAMLSNYRGAKVAGIPEADVTGVLSRLAQAADQEGHMPPRAIAPAPIYLQLALVLEQLGLNRQGDGAPGI